MNTLTIRRPDDFHVHLRRFEMMQKVVGFTADHFARALIMPNTDSPIETSADVEHYRREIIEATPGASFDPLMTIKLTRNTRPAAIYAAREAGVVAAKFYPEGATTNANGGFRCVTDVPRDVLGAMAACGMVLCLHGEDPAAFVMDRERNFLPQINRILADHPMLRCVLEHVTTEDAVVMVRERPDDGRLGATITAHHLWTTLDDVVGGLLEPHAFCKPVPKRPRDRAALVLAATIDDPRFFFGSDSAPHDRSKKECAHGCAGAFTAPVALALLAEVFEHVGRLSNLEAFVSERGATFYGLKKNEGTITLETRIWPVAREIRGIVPFMAGREMRWQVV